MRSSVDLPQPERPTTRHELPFGDLEIDPVDRLAAPPAHPAGRETLRDPFDRDHGPAAVRVTASAERYVAVVTNPGA